MQKTRWQSRSPIKIFIISNSWRSLGPSNRTAQFSVFSRLWAFVFVFLGQRAESTVIWAACVWLAVSATQHGGLPCSDSVGIIDPWVVLVCCRHHRLDLTLRILGWDEAARCPLYHQTRTTQEPVKSTE